MVFLKQFLNKKNPLFFGPKTFGIPLTKGDRLEAVGTLLVSTPFCSSSPLSHLLFPVYLSAISFGLTGGGTLQTYGGKD
ncbi:hypothetical protein QUH73_13810 [Labilibaculum sp. K2S]|uniref:hypothetical protein n=1 Tax=Labilibaculum sp. K2S TaxID=3056386 RepID=UPI0025A3E062|nr:hypothetical protein [Labilibaculum sp. K2S]MDM8160895.1 hypothetical protein [Labilibaculum sp. K2S]